MLMFGVVLDKGALCCNLLAYCVSSVARVVCMSLFPDGALQVMMWNAMSGKPESFIDDIDAPTAAAIWRCSAESGPLSGLSSATSSRQTSAESPSC
jgi:hypothetical protein